MLILVVIVHYVHMCIYMLVLRMFYNIYSFYQKLVKKERFIAVSVSVCVAKNAILH